MHIDDKDAYPEGGLKAWLVVFGAWCAMVPATGLLNTMAVLHAWISEHELPDMPESTIGWILSAYACLLYLCGAQVGKWTIDYFHLHRRRHRAYHLKAYLTDVVSIL